MPQLDLKYSASLNLDVTELFSVVEKTLIQLDGSAGHCKCRAYPSDQYQHTHILCQVSILNKPHRDESFMQECLLQLEKVIAQFIPKGCHYAVELKFSSEYYSTHLN
jgi:hypothetical protein